MVESKCKARSYTELTLIPPDTQGGFECPTTMGIIAKTGDGKTSIFVFTIVAGFPTSDQFMELHSDSRGYTQNPVSDQLLEGCKHHR